MMPTSRSGIRWLSDSLGEQDRESPERPFFLTVAKSWSDCSLKSTSRRNKEPRTPAQPSRRNLLWCVAQVALRIVFALWLRYRARGAEKIRPAGGGLLLINHQSFLDPLLAGLPLNRPVCYLARDSLFRVPVLGWILRQTYVIPINREGAGSTSIREAIGKMRQGYLVGIFPEGTRSRDGEPNTFRPGFIALIRRADVPVYPVGIAGASEALPRHACFLRPARVRVVFGDPFRPEELAQLCERGQEEKLVAEAEERVAACRREAETWRQR